MAAGAFAFSIMSLLVKLAGQRLPSQEIVFARSLVVAMLCWATLRHAGLDARGTRRRLLVVRGVLGFIALSCFYYAVIHLPLADATVIQYTNPAFTALLAVPLLHEKLRVREFGWVFASLAGVVLMTRPALLFGGAARLDPFAVTVGVAGALFSAAAYVTVRKLGETEHALVIVLYFATLSVVGSAVPVALNPVIPRPGELALLAAVGVTTHAGQLLVTKGLSLERAGRATAISYVQVLFAAGWGALVFGTIPDVWAFLGALLVAAGVIGIANEKGAGAGEGEGADLGAR